MCEARLSDMTVTASVIQPVAPIARSLARPWASFRTADTTAVTPASRPAMRAVMMPWNMNPTSTSGRALRTTATALATPASLPTPPRAFRLTRHTLGSSTSARSDTSENGRYDSTVTFQPRHRERVGDDDELPLRAAAFQPGW